MTLASSRECAQRETSYVKSCVSGSDMVYGSYICSAITVVGSVTVRCLMITVAYNDGDTLWKMSLI